MKQAVMNISIKVPSPGESITEVELAKWLVEDGDIIEKDQEIAEIDSDKATLTINAEESGKITLKATEGNTLKVGAEIAIIDTSFKPKLKEQALEEKSKSIEAVEKKNVDQKKESDIIMSPQAKELLNDLQIDIESIDKLEKSGRITKKDILRAIASEYKKANENQQTTMKSNETWSRGGRVEKMSSLRKKLSQRLVAVKNETAMLTTFNEIDMSAVINLRNKYKTSFIEQHGIKLGFMSFFAKAASIALQKFEAVNAQIENDEIRYFDYADIGVAVSTPKGLMVPVIRNAESKGIVQLEKDIFKMAEKARTGKIAIEDMQGGTFTITNGGVFGSMLSTPIINPPQSAILGMHNIVDRPVAIDGKIEIKPIMYVALSYDHRIIDGRESVGFLLKIKEFIENPRQMLSNDNPDKILLDL